MEVVDLVPKVVARHAQAVRKISFAPIPTSKVCAIPGRSLLRPWCVLETFGLKQVDLFTTASEDAVVRLWSGGSGECLAELQGHTDQVHILARKH